MFISALAHKSPAVSVCAHPGPLAASLRLFIVSVPLRVKFYLEGRSSRWYTISRNWLKLHPTCINCGKKTNVIVHHIEPFHVNPARELDPTNFASLCENKTLNCHLWQGHNGNFQSFNATVLKDSATFIDRLRKRPIVPFSPEN